MMDDHILARTQQRLPGKRTPSRGALANDEQRLIDPNDVPTKRTKHATRHSPGLSGPTAEMSSVFHPRHRALPRRRRPLHKQARGLTHSTEREEFVRRAPRGKPVLTRKQDSMRRRTAVSQNRHLRNRPRSRRRSARAVARESPCSPARGGSAACSISANARRRRARAIARAPRPAVPQCHDRHRQVVGVSVDSLGGFRALDSGALRLLSGTGSRLQAVRHSCGCGCVAARTWLG